MQVWQMQDAEAHLSEVVRCANSLGPQNITLNGQPVAVVISQDMYEKLAGKQQSLVSFMRTSPLYAKNDVQLDRCKSPTRKVSL